MKFGYKFSIRQHCTFEEREEEQYGSYSTEWDNSLQSVSKADKYPDVVSSFDFKPGDKAYAVWLEYSNGDSFGSNKRGSIEAVGLFEDYICAQELREAINNFNPDVNTSDWQDKYRFFHKTIDDQEFTFGFAPWSGYFEHLEEVHIEEVTIQ